VNPFLKVKNTVDLVRNDQEKIAWSKFVLTLTLFFEKIQKKIQLQMRLKKLPFPPPSPHHNNIFKHRKTGLPDKLVNENTSEWFLLQPAQPMP
jgi:hypothetical protein